MYNNVKIRSSWPEWRRASVPLTYTPKSLQRHIWCGYQCFSGNTECLYITFCIPFVAWTMIRFEISFERNTVWNKKKYRFLICKEKDENVTKLSNQLMSRETLRSYGEKEWLVKKHNHTTYLRVNITPLQALGTDRAHCTSLSLSPHPLSIYLFGNRLHYTFSGDTNKGAGVLFHVLFGIVIARNVTIKHHQWILRIH